MNQLCWIWKRRLAWGSIGCHDDKNKNQPEEKEDDLDATDDGEPSQEPHGASNETQLGLHLDLLVSLDVVKGGRVKVDLHQLQSWRWQFLT